MMVAYTRLTQQDVESTSHYLISTKVLLEHMNHTCKLSQISGKRLNNLALVDKLIFSKNRINFCWETSFRQISIMASSRSEEMLI